MVFTIIRALFRPVLELLFACGFAYAAWVLQSPFYREWVVIYYLLCFLSGWFLLCAINSVLFVIIPQAFRYRRILKAQGRVGSANWADKKDLRRKKLFNRNGFFAGAFNQCAVFFNIESAGLVLSPAGGGKTVNFVIPALCHQAMNMIVPDLKGILACMTGDYRKKYFKHEIIHLNPGGLYRDKLGVGARYNPLIILIDDWNDPAQHVHLFPDARSIAKQLCPEPAQASENEYWRNGSRKFLVFAFIYLVTLESQIKEATLSSALNLLSDPEYLETSLRVAAKGDILQGDLARLAKDMIAKIDHGDPKQIESFREGAVQVLEVFSASGSLAECTSTCDFRFADLRDKKKKTTVYLIADPTRMAVYAPWLGLVSWCAMTELIRKANGVPVCFLCDEITNFKIEGLPSLLTLAREFKIILWLIVQELEEWAKTYGRDSLETLLSQTEAKIIMGSRNFKTCQLVSNMLGDMPQININHNLGKSFLDPVSRSVSEGSRRLMTADEVRRTDQIIAFYRDEKPILLDKVGYHEIKPWSQRVGINPLFGKRFRGKTKLRL